MIAEGETTIVKPFSLDTPQLKEKYRSLCATVVKALKSIGTEVRPLTVDFDDVGADLRVPDKIIDAAMEVSSLPHTRCVSARLLTREILVVDGRTH